MDDIEATVMNIFAASALFQPKLRSGADSVIGNYEEYVRPNTFISSSVRKLHNT